MFLMAGPGVANAAIGKALIEIGKALGKAVVAGVGMELARAASGHVKRIAGPKAKKGAPEDTGNAAGDSKRSSQASDQGANDLDDGPHDGDDNATLARVKAENLRLRQELAALREERDTSLGLPRDGGRVAVAVDVADGSGGIDD